MEEINIIDKSKIRVSGLTVKSELNPDIFNGMKMKNEVKDALLRVATSFLSFVPTISADTKPTDVVVVGDSVNFTWNKSSPLDLYIILDMNSMSDDINELKSLFRMAKSVYNYRHDLELQDIKVKLHIIDNKEEIYSNSIYSVKSNIWIRKPSRSDTSNINRDAIVNDVYYYMRVIDKLKVMTDHVKRYTLAVQVKDKLISLRKTSLKNDGELGDGNLLFKSLRNNKYLLTLSEIIIESYENLLNS
jgi:hypothetical protein